MARTRYPGGRGSASAVWLVAALCGLQGGPAWGARPAAGASPLPAWGGVERALGPAVERALGGREAGRLLRRPVVRRALREAFAGFRQGRDRAVVTLTPAEPAPGGRQQLVVRVYVGGTSRCLRLDPGYAERGPASCRGVTPPPPRTVRLDDALWRRPARPRGPTRPTRPTRPVPPPAEAAPPEGASPRSVLRLPGLDRGAPPVEVSEGARLLGDLASLRDRARAAVRLDPFAPRWQVGDEAPDVRLQRARRRSAWPRWTSIEGNALENLRDIFGQGRMRPAWPVPDFFGRRARRPPGHDAAGMLAPPEAACLASWAAREHHPSPPRLACFRQALRHGRLSRDKVYQAANLLGRFLAVPMFGQIMVMRVGETRRETVSSLLWVHTWMGWAGLHPTRLAAAGGLTRAERERLREHLWRWWGRRAYEAYDGTITRLYERHFGALYPASLGPDGLPAWGRLPNPALWGMNWLHAVEGLPAGRRTATVAALCRAVSARPEPLRVLRSLVAQPEVARGVPRTVAALHAALAEARGSAATPR